MKNSPLAGQPAPLELLIDVSKIRSDYIERKPDTDAPQQLVSFGTSGHRGTPLDGTFTESHILAITQAICDYRSAQGITGPLFMGKDTHAVSAPAEQTALEVLAANDIITVVQNNDGFTPTPAISRAILNWNSGGNSSVADGIVVTPSHNPPEDGGIKYNACNGGPADADVTSWIEKRANKLLKCGNRGVKRIPHKVAMRKSTTQEQDFVPAYIRDLASVIDLDVIRSQGVRIGIDPMGGAAIGYWQPLAEKFRLNITVVNQKIDPTFSFMMLDHDGKIRMDCSSGCAMAGLVQLKDRYDIAFGNDPDADRHGIVTPRAGLMNPNHYLAAAIRYLLTHRPQWPTSAKVGKTVVSSGMIDRVVKNLKWRLWEGPVGFKWFATHLLHGDCCFGGEESAGASFLKRDGSVWTTDKDGLLLGLLAAEITAVTGKDPGEHYDEITGKFGTSYYERVDAPATPEQKARFKKLTAEVVTVTEIAGEQIVSKLTHAPGNHERIGGLKVVTQNGWFAARPSGTENIYKLYAESFKSQEHLEAIIREGRQIVNRALASC